MRKFEVVKRINEYSTSEEMVVRLPERSTKNSMAYDFFAIEGFEVKPGEKYMYKSGIKAKMNDDEGLVLNVRSSMGKKGIMLANTSAWIDSDFYDNPDNEGEIGIYFYNYGTETWKVNAGDKIAQGMFIKYLTTDDDNVENVRKGGWGSTDG